MAQQNGSTVPEVVVLESRKFLNMLNSSAQARIRQFEEAVQSLGQQVKAEWSLAALQGKTMLIEDKSGQKFFMADHRRDQGRLVIENIRPITIMEKTKQKLFYDSCVKLVESIDENDQKGMAVAFDRMKKQRFTGRAVPHSGVVCCKDGVSRRLQIVPEGVELADSVRAQIVECVVDSLRDRVLCENGNVVAGYFNDGDPIKLPVTTWGLHKLTANKMRQAAENAYWSEGFQQRMAQLATLVSEGKVPEAVKFITPFLEEMEEFTLLGRAKTHVLVENTLAACGIFNQELCDDTATLFHRTNLKINRNKIVKEWRAIAKKAAHPVLAENVYKLAETKNFEHAYNQFLHTVFEAISNREATAEALATTLQLLRDKTPKIRESHELSGRLNGLINRLKQQNMDDASIFEAEELLATIQEELAATENLQDFDAMPGEAPLDGAAGSDAGSDIGGGQPQIVLNAPLIQIGGSSGAAEEPPAPAGDEAAGDEFSDAEGDDELDALLSGDGAAPAAPTPPPAGGATPPAPPGGQAPMPNVEGRQSNKTPLVEDDNGDPYAFRGTTVRSRSLADYGVPAISNRADLYNVVKVMTKLVEEGKLKPKAIAESLGKIAKASIGAVGLRLPEHKLPAAIKQAVELFQEEWKKPWLKDEEQGDDDDSTSFDDDTVEEGEEHPFEGSPVPTPDDDLDEVDVVEDQFRSPKIPQRGLKKQAIKKMDESITWLTKQQDGLLGELDGVRFIYDHGAGQLPPVILSEDGNTAEIPIPRTLAGSAAAAARMSTGDPKPFVKWLRESLEDLRPMTDDESTEIDNIVATIAATPDGSLKVTTADGVEITQPIDGATEPMGEPGLDGDAGLDGEMPGDPAAVPGGEAELAGGLGGEEELAGGLGDDEMAPVASVEAAPPGDEGEEVESEEMPDFDRDELADEPMAEDKNITSPSNSGYLKHVKEDPRTDATPDKPEDGGEDLDGIGPKIKEGNAEGTNATTSKSE
jgi:hypothetical protein